MNRRHDAQREWLSELLKRLRVEARLRQEDVAARIGRSQSYVSKYERGHLQLDFVEVHEVCRALEVPLPTLARRFEREAVRPAADRRKRYPRGAPRR